MNAQPPEVKAVFDRALEIDDPAERLAYLERIGVESPEVRARVEELLRAHEDAGSFLQRVTQDEPPRERPGMVIGSYKLLQQIGEGGMGVVYMAEQETPVRRRVALKIIKPGMDSAQVIARFEAERQALALMDHQNIARVLEAGATDSGRPYFVMELVHGVPITKYCDDNKLTPRQRLELFVPVCQAVQHAHQKGIIHRDLKPSNILVTLYDGKPVPKVIDFGVAKATEQRLTERTLFTQYGTIVGTFEYMAPEQAEMSALGVDTRSDVYSLGVLLYELLTGTTPLERARLRGAALGEMLRLIREEEPPKPSARISTSGQALATISQQRNTEAAKLAKLMRGELDWIVMKALEKDRTRRYETASGLARDVDRYLKDEAVEACPPSRWYRVRKFARKNKRLLFTAGAFVTLLLVTTGVSIWLAVREHNAQVEANSQRVRAEAVRSFLEKDLLSQAGTFTQLNDGWRPDPDIKLRTVLDRASARISGKFDGQPRTEITIRTIIGGAYIELGLDEQAQPHLERALELVRLVFGDDHFATLIAMHNLGKCYSNQGNYAKAEPMLALESRRRILGDEHRDTIITAGDLARVYIGQKRYAEAEALLLKALEGARRVIGEEDVETISIMSELGMLYYYQGDYARAEPLLSTTLEIKRRTLGENHLYTIHGRLYLGLVYKQEGKYAEAEHLLLTAVKGNREVMGDGHRDTLRAINAVVELYDAWGKKDKADEWRAQLEAERQLKARRERGQ